MSGHIGGSLKLKGGQTLQTAGVKKKKKKPAQGSPEKALTLQGDSSAPEGEGGSNSQGKALTGEELLKVVRGEAVAARGDGEDRRTEAEKRFEQRQIQLEAERLKKLAGKSHRDRVKDFNEHLAKLSEHHDIPRVGPG